MWDVTGGYGRLVINATNLFTSQAYTSSGSWSYREQALGSILNMLLFSGRYQADTGFCHLSIQSTSRFRTPRSIFQAFALHPL